jgi:large subunit ribosomal protein L15
VKLHDLQPAPGSTKRRIRVGRGIAAGKGKTAGRGTKGQRSRSGASIPAWFEGGQTPVHVRVPKLRGFKRRGRIEYQVVNGRISVYRGRRRFRGERHGAAHRHRRGACRCRAHQPR